jgi:hypothetical protein
MQWRVKAATDLEPAGGVRLHDLAHVAHELRERGANLAMLDHEGLGNTRLFAGCAGSGAALKVRAVLAFLCHRASTRERLGEDEEEKIEARDKTPPWLWIPISWLSSTAIFECACQLLNHRVHNE